MGFIELDRSRFGELKAFAETCEGEKEYYLSVISGIHRGRAYVDDPENIRAVLFRHYCGYAYLAGEPDAEFVDNTKRMLTREHPFYTEDTLLHKMFILQQNGPLAAHFEDMTGLRISERLCFQYRGELPRLPALPEGYSIRLMQAEDLERIEGKVVPSFSWSSHDEFRRNGVGCCIVHGEDIASWTFAAALAGGRLDIGVETAEGYRGRGLAKIAAAWMVRCAMWAKFLPVWGCDLKNEASAKTALSVGFTLTAKHPKFCLD